MLSALLRVRTLRGEGLRRALGRLGAEREALERELAQAVDAQRAHGRLWREQAAGQGLWSHVELQTSLCALARCQREALALSERHAALMQRLDDVARESARTADALRGNLRAQEKLRLLQGETAAAPRRGRR